MTFHLGQHVISGFIDNSIKGIITGELKVDGLPEPIILNLKGNAMADLAGCVIHFENPNHCPIDVYESDGLLIEQDGNAGEFTASRKMRLERHDPNVDLPFENGFDDPQDFELMNVVDFVWYDPRLFRMVLRAPRYQLKIDLPKWQITDLELEEQNQKSKAAAEIYQTLFYDALIEQESENLDEEDYWDAEEEDDDDIPF